MTGVSLSKSAAVRARLSHPVIDADAHHIEFEPGLLDYVRQAAGPKVAERFERWVGTLLDEWTACQIEKAEDVRDLFVPSF
jgi:hypothetical protein